jgi:membrane complex biogenesis BtpA family protein
MVHLLPLPGSPRARPLGEVIAAARRDASALLEAGFDGVVVENFGDAPFLPTGVEPVTIAALTRVAAELQGLLAGRCSLCVNVLRNDARSALGVAVAVGAGAIRVNVHAGARVTDQGVVEGRAWETLRLRSAWGGADVAIWADVGVKHSVGLGSPALLPEDEVGDVVQRWLADAVIVSGGATGATADPATLARVAARSSVPVLVGSGVSAATVAACLSVAHGVIVGTSIKEGGVTTAAVDPRRAAALVAAAG